MNKKETAYCNALGRIEFSDQEPFEIVLPICEEFSGRSIYAEAISALAFHAKECNELFVPGLQEHPGSLRKYQSFCNKVEAYIKDHANNN